MKFILYSICIIALLSSTGCIFPGGGGDRGYHGGGHSVDNDHPDHGDHGGDHSDNGGNHDDHH
ncbi:MAG TPA: hypothetical protein VKV04_01500 [Verrucomicrobiae bacterium]|nr:hypothetical protein [Verrucomicrobiae bacterium]